MLHAPGSTRPAPGPCADPPPNPFLLEKSGTGWKSRESPMFSLSSPAVTAPIGENRPGVTCAKPAKTLYCLSIRRQSRCHCVIVATDRWGNGRRRLCNHCPDLPAMVFDGPNVFGWQDCYDRRSEDSRAETVAGNARPERHRRNPRRGHGPSGCNVEYRRACRRGTCRGRFAHALRIAGHGRRLALRRALRLGPWPGAGLQAGEHRRTGLGRVPGQTGKLIAPHATKRSHVAGTGHGFFHFCAVVCPDPAHRDPAGDGDLRTCDPAPAPRTPPKLTPALPSRRFPGDPDGTSYRHMRPRMAAGSTPPPARRRDGSGRVQTRPRPPDVPAGGRDTDR